MSDNIIEKQIENARTTVSMFGVKLTEKINRRIEKSNLVELMRKTFKQFDDCALSELWENFWVFRTQYHSERLLMPHFCLYFLRFSMQICILVIRGHENF